jgi:hypothetical protein
MTERLETKSKIENIETAVNALSEQIELVKEMIEAQQEAIIDSQRYILRLAEMQKGMERKIATWPYVKVENKIPKNSN